MSKSTVAFIVGKIIQVGGVLILTALGGKKAWDAHQEKPKSKPKTKSKPKK